MRPFHLAVPVPNIEKARQFYVEILGCSEGRSAETWIDLNFFGHQLVFHQNPRQEIDRFINPVDKHPVPVPHFGVILVWEDWEALVERLRSHHILFAIEPYVRFAGKKGEQATMFFFDCNGLALEFKAFKNDDMIFDH